MNFDLESSWLGATLVIHRRLFFFFLFSILICRIGGGDLDGNGCDPHQTHPTLGGHSQDFSG